jgi:threonine/homoserine/homoserine lactone efflux protein
MRQQLINVLIFLGFLVIILLLILDVSGAITLHPEVQSVLYILNGALIIFVSFRNRKPHHAGKVGGTDDD